MRLNEPLVKLITIRGKVNLKNEIFNTKDNHNGMHTIQLIPENYLLKTVFSENSRRIVTIIILIKNQIVLISTLFRHT